MEYTIKANSPIEGKHWELEFHRGIAETDDRALAEKYKARGYSVIRQKRNRKKAE